MASRDLERLETGIPGFDLLSQGGLPRNRSTLVAGTSGSGKTVFGVQFLARGILDSDEAGVFVTFEESPDDIRQNIASFGWPISEWEQQGKWCFVDASPDYEDETIVVGTYDLAALLARIEHAVRSVGATRLVMDSIAALSIQFPEPPTVRRELFRIGAALKQVNVTSILTTERPEEYGPVGRFGVEDFVSDNVIILRNTLELEKRRRTIELLKLRGTSHHKGEYPFSIISDEGFVILPLSTVELTERASEERIPSGIPELDNMCNGGFFRESIILVSGATGTGKTLTSTHFVDAGCQQGEPCLLLAFEESRGQLLRNAAAWGFDFERREREGLLQVRGEYPGSASLEDHLIRIRALIDKFKPRRVVVDSLSALEPLSRPRVFREFVTGLTASLKKAGAAGLLTSTTPTLFGGPSITESHISTITDSIILLRYVEIFGEMHRGLTVLKMRGSEHDKDIREFVVDGNGMQIGSPFRAVSGILSGSTSHATPEEVSVIEELLGADDG